MEEKQSGEQDEKIIEEFGKPEETERVRVTVIPIAKRFIKQISLFANNKYADGARITGAVACAIMEEVIVSLALRMHKIDEEAGAKFIESVYDCGKKDALARWRNL